nr:hypothetical protein [Klebsiella quasipneumoniae]
MSWNDLSHAYDVLGGIAAGEVLVYPDKFEDGVKIEKNWQRGNVRVATEYDEYRVRGLRRNMTSIVSEGTLMEKLALISRQEWMLTLFLQLGGINLKDLFGEKNFDFPKAKGLVKNAILACTGKDQRMQFLHVPERIRMKR